MGIYDTVHAKCVHCGAYAEDQIKPGTMRFYDLDNQPQDCLAHLVGRYELACSKCSKTTIVEIKAENITVTKTAV